MKKEETFQILEEYLKGIPVITPIPTTCPQNS